jgi:hypothetical protein
LARNHEVCPSGVTCLSAKLLFQWGLGLWCLTSLSNFFQLYLGGCFSELAL